MAVVLVGRSVVVPGTYLPQCKANGDFEEVQCHGSERFCWCVDKNGDKLIDFTHPRKDLQCVRRMNQIYHVTFFPNSSHFCI